VPWLDLAEAEREDLAALLELRGGALVSRFLKGCWRSTGSTKWASATPLEGSGRGGRMAAEVATTRKSVAGKMLC
jgi:hypothetical protein